MKMLLIHIVLILIAFSYKAQNTFQTGILPSFNLNKKITDSWKLNLKIESRQQLKEYDYNTDIINNYNYILTDYSVNIVRKTGFNSSISGGYLLRFRNNQVHHRFTQQYSVVKKYERFRLAHRICFDETIIPTSTIYRGRYRITGEIPLNGYSIDNKETYLKINNEYVNSLNNSFYDLEIRIVPIIGYKISDKNKVETGFDYRINNFISSLPNHKLWFILGWYLSI